MRTYSNFLETLYDQEGPVGILGRGTHYSVFRALCWHDATLQPSETCQAHDFSVIWDEDHDIRVIGVVERMYAAGVLPAALYIGERKGALSIIVSPQSATALDRKGLAKLVALVESFVDPSDPWNVEAVPLGSPSSIISASEDDIELYIKSINLLWRVGLKPLPESLWGAGAQRGGAAVSVAAERRG